MTLRPSFPLIARVAGSLLLVFSLSLDLFSIGEPGIGEKQLALATIAILVILSTLLPTNRQSAPHAGNTPRLLLRAYTTIGLILFNTALVLVLLNLLALPVARSTRTP